MHNGLELEAPMNPELSAALSFAVRALSGAAAIWLVAHAIRWW